MESKKRQAYIEDLVNELSETLDEKYQCILDDKPYDNPNFEEIIQKRKITKKESDVLVEVFVGAFQELIDLNENKNPELTEQYSWLEPKKQKELLNLVDSLVNACISGYILGEQDSIEMEKIIEHLKNED